MPADPLSPPSNAGSTSFNRKSSLFSKKSRPSLPTVESTVEEDEQDPTVPTNDSLTSLASSNPDAQAEPRRSLSLRSHKSQSSGSIQVHKRGSPSIGFPATFSPPSPKRSHRLSRSISAGFKPTNHSPQKSQEEVPQPPKDSPLQKGRHRIYTAPAPPPKSAAHMLAMSRRPSEAHSTFSASNFAAPNPIPPAPSAPLSASGFSPMAIYNHINETTSKRMATLEYMRKVHEGQVFFFSTISYTSSQLSSLPSLHPSRLGRRATNYLLLGTSLPPLLELHSSNPTDYLKALSTLLAEYDTYSSLSTSESGVSSLSRGRMGQMLKSGMRNVKGRRTSSATDSLMSDTASTNGSSNTNMSTLADAMPLPPISNSGHDFQYLQLPNLPFDPDFSTSLATLTDVLMDAYSGLLTLLPGPEACPPGLAEAFAKADKQLRKVMMSGMVNEFGENTRKEARAEVAGIGRLVLSGLM